MPISWCRIIYLYTLPQSHSETADFNDKHLNWGFRYTNTWSHFLLRVISSSHAKTLSLNNPTYWPTHANRHPDILDFFLSNLPNHLKTQITYPKWSCLGTHSSFIENQYTSPEQAHLKSCKLAQISKNPIKQHSSQHKIKNQRRYRYSIQ